MGNQSETFMGVERGDAGAGGLREQQISRAKSFKRNSSIKVTFAPCSPDILNIRLPGCPDSRSCEIDTHTDLIACFKFLIIV